MRRFTVLRAAPRLHGLDQTRPAGSSPFLLPPRPPQTQQHSLLGLWHLLSLDAPTVAAVWTWFTAYCCHVSLRWTSPSAMFVAVWMLYAADRLLDARHGNGQPGELEERHRFHAKHRRAFFTGIACGAVALAALLRGFSAPELRLFAALGSLLFAYFFLIHLWPASSRTQTAGFARLPKELAVGVFFAAAVFIPSVARNPALRISLLPAALFLAAVCTLNCLYVYTWEHPRDLSAAHWTTRFALERLTALTWLAFAGALAAALCLHASRVAPLCVACGLSAGAFLLLHTCRRHVAPTTLRADVDLALLTPLLLAAGMAVAAR